MIRSRGRVAQRDIVQFVPFSKFKAQGPERLAMEVLAEVSVHTQTTSIMM